jgi:hypothetical protein
MARSIFIGDVHGCSRELSELLEKVGPMAGDSVCFVGDLVARGPDSRGVLRIFKDTKAVGVRGNHEARLLRVREERRSGEAVTKLGANHEALMAELDEDDWRVLEELKLYRELPGHGVVVVHAGVAPGVPLDAQDVWTLTNIRSVDDRGPSAASGRESWSVSYRGPPHVIFGHDARRGLQLRSNATGLDSGCVYGGALTALVLPAGETLPPPEPRRDLLVSVPAHTVYYADHRSP